MAYLSSRTVRALLVSLIVSLAASLTACGGGVKLEDLESSFEDALCERQVRCGAYATVDACKEDFRILIDEIERAVAAGRANYDADKAEACLEALSSSSCDGSAEDVRRQPQACRDTFTGTVADGGACFGGEECLSERCTIPDCGMACCQGTCAVTVAEVAIGGACSGTTGPCAQGSFCDSQTTTCAALRAVGAACTSNSQCGYGLYCPEVGTCADAPNRGAACPDGTCADIGDRCSTTSMTCVALGRSGEACATGFAGLFDCQAPLTCNQTTLVCGNPPTVGQTCLFFCASGNFCNQADVCEATKANGAACAGDDECNSQFCDANDVCADDVICG